MLKSLKAFFFEPCAQQPRETPIVQATAGESDLFNSRILASHFRSADECRRNPGMETRSDARFARTRTEIFEEFRPQRFGGNSRRLARTPVSMEQLKRVTGTEFIRLVHSQSFQLNCRLRLVRNSK
jgi:hypothetical protein